MSRTSEASARPRVSVVIPAYRSDATIARCLRAIEAQTYRDFETIVVDSSPDEKTADVVRGFSFVNFFRSTARLLPHAARNQGVTLARGELLVFTDPDIYPPPDWLARMVAAYDEHGGVVVGAIDCYGDGLRDRAMHLCKFSKWLPYGARRPVDMSPTGNMLVRRDEFDHAGGLPGDLFLGDITLSRALQARGTALVFEPGAVVEHHHEDTFRSFLRTRFVRGIWYGEMRTQWTPRSALVVYLAVTVLPVRLTRIAALMAMHGRGDWKRWIAPYPAALLGHVISLAGEAIAYAKAVFGVRRQSRR
ncbi:MAG TPA: glycosyltransferase family A protein [Thermoanaerobaculia bacterium]|nr:glycosyltransferase family A protein [Thermoanaerobaculia bacterium]